MKEIKKHIENYGFTINQINEDQLRGYYCKNTTSNSEFILDFTSNNLEQLDTICETYYRLYNNKIQVVFLIQVCGNIEEIINSMQNDENMDKQFLIYDKEDEIEYFLKDLWNVILSLDRK